MAKITLNNIEFELDMLNADTVDRYTKLNQKIAEDIREPKQYEGLSTADGMRLQCKLVDKYLDDLFGEGSAKKVFGDDTGNLGARLEAFAQCAKLGETATERVDEIAGKYGFQRVMNRAQRRAKK